MRRLAEVYEFGSFRARVAEGTLHRDGKTVPVTPKVFETLVVLLRSAGRVVSKEALMEALWPDSFVEEGNLTFNMSRLRKALGEKPGLRYIETVPRRGYRFVAPVSTGRRAAAAEGSGPSQIVVGRARELETLGAALADVEDTGHGRLVCIAGEPGLGKTRLVESFFAGEMARAGGLLLRGRCSERLAGTGAYLPILEALDDLMRSGDADAVEPVLRARAPSWHALTLGGGGKDVEAASQERLKRELVAFLQDIAVRGPVVLLLDDLHWADISTTDLLGYLGHRLDTLGVLAIACYRGSEIALAGHPFVGVRQELQGRGLCHEIALELLRPADVIEFLNRRYPGNAFSGGLAAHICEKTDGNPLFMVHVLRDLEQTRAIARESGGGFRLREDWLDVASTIPESVRSVIERKIGQLCVTGRMVLTVASVQGSEFDSAVVAAAVKRPQEEVEELVDRLEREHALVTRVAERELPDGTLSMRCRFVHTLYQNVLYATLAPARRASLSRRIADELAQRFVDRVDDVASELAMLHEAGRDLARGSECFLIAARRALRVFAFPEAAALARRGLALSDRLSPGRERTARELTLQVALGVALMSKDGFAAPEVRRVYARALELSRALPPSAELVPAYAGMWLFHTISSQLATARDLAEQIVELTPDDAEPADLAQAHQALGITLMDQGEVPAAIDTLGRAIAFDRARGDRHSPLRVAFDPGVASRAALGYALATAGRLDEASAAMREALSQCRELGHVPTTGFALTFAAMVSHVRGEPEEVERYAAESLELSEEHGMVQSRSWAAFWHGWALVARGDTARGIVEMRQAIDDYRKIGSRIAAPLFVGLLGEAVRRGGDVDEALSLTTAALEENRETGQAYEPEVALYRAWTLRDAGDPAGAEAALDHGLAAAERQGARWWRLLLERQWAPLTR